MEESQKVTAKEAGKFGLVGIFNTLFDFTIFNILSRIGIPALVANTVSTGLAMTVSFILNRKWVFEAESGKNQLLQAVKFFAVTAFGLWVLQNSVFAFLKSEVWFQSFAIWVRSIAFNLFDDQFFIDNGAKAFGVAVSFVWNFVLYKKIVFKK